jgi:hypothetical protein
MRLYGAKKEKKMKITVFSSLFLVLLFGLTVNACSKNSSKNPSTDSSTESTATASLGNYPADYGIAYFNVLGVSNAPTVRDLYGPSAPFATTVNGLPAKITFESSSGNQNEFTATLLLTMTTDEEENMKVMRMQVTFQPDSMTERSYVRYVKIANLITGQISEQASRGTEMEDGRLFGLLAGMLDYFWDTSKLSL